MPPAITASAATKPINKANFLRDILILRKGFESFHARGCGEFQMFASVRSAGILSAGREHPARTRDLKELARCQRTAGRDACAPIYWIAIFTVASNPRKACDRLHVRR